MTTGPDASGRLFYRRLVGLLALATLVAAAVGTYPTVRQHGPAGLLAAAAALGINVPVFLLAGWVVRRAARRGGTMAAAKVLGWTGFLRLIVVAGAGVAVEPLLTQWRMTFWLWLVGLYVLMALAEAWWAGKGFSTTPTPNNRNGASS